LCFGILCRCSLLYQSASTDDAESRFLLLIKPKLYRGFAIYPRCYSKPRRKARGRFLGQAGTRRPPQSLETRWARQEGSRTWERVGLGGRISWARGVVHVHLVRACAPFEAGVEGGPGVLVFAADGGQGAKRAQRLATPSENKRTARAAQRLQHSPVRATGCSFAGVVIATGG